MTATQEMQEQEGRQRGLSGHANHGVRRERGFTDQGTAAAAAERERGPLMRESDSDSAYIAQACLFTQAQLLVCVRLSVAQEPGSRA